MLENRTEELYNSMIKGILRGMWRRGIPTKTVGACHSAWDSIS